jgi:hypothetical protein
MSEPPVQRIEPPAFLAEPMLAAVLAALPEARVVGGAVRDALAGRTVAEVDLATPRTPEQVQKSLQAAGIRIVPTGLDHGTVTAVANGRSFEVTTLRRDVETDGRHAVVVFTDDWRADAARRDFTINAMSLDRTGDLYDLVICAPAFCASSVTRRRALRKITCVSCGTSASTRTLPAVQPIPPRWQRSVPVWPESPGCRSSAYGASWPVSCQRPIRVPLSA